MAAAPNVFPCSWNPIQGPGGWREKLAGWVQSLRGGWPWSFGRPFLRVEDTARERERESALLSLRCVIKGLMNEWIEDRMGTGIAVS